MRRRVALVGPTRLNPSGIAGGIVRVLTTWMASSELSTWDVRCFESSANPGPRVRRALSMAAAQARYARALTRSDRPALVHAHFGGVVTFYREGLYCAEARALSIPYIAHLHGCMDTQIVYRQSAAHARVIRAVLRHASSIVVVTGSIVPWIEEIIDNPPPMHVLHNPVDPVGLPTLPLDAPRSDGRPTVLFLGWMIVAKGIFDLLDCVPDVAAIIPDVRFVLAGGGVELERLRAEIRDRHLEAWVEAPGWVRGAERAQVFEEATAFCLPSHSEGFPVSIVEAMFVGLPVVATDISGIAEAVEHNRTGLLFAPKDVPALAAALIEVLQDPQRAFELACAARQWVLQNADRDRIAAKVTQIWSQTLDG